MRCVYPSRSLWLAATMVMQGINLLILASTVSLCMSTMPRFNPDKIMDRFGNRTNTEPWRAVWEILEVVCVAAFSVDFFVRVCAAFYMGHVKKFWKDALNWVDLVAILPFYLEILIGSVVDLRFVRVIRLVRICPRPPGAVKRP